ncbi:MAG: hypothetical protein BD935_00030 [Marine Group III euryarchaeote CG-Epi1]|uniref:Uncharacterized protein n=1 Tax=Marine Group III euryarchaeote CG-Epi1 TaxID=1888995 RepID=A0A1J5TXB5_9ARCH|nr:MAG: hypothetical protein BD935_00030 [Marine Group III euryarchaeote CG-Epi1]
MISNPTKVNKKILFCDIDSTINDHWKRIKKWTIPEFPGEQIHWKAFIRKELMKDKPLPNAINSISRLSEKYEIHFLTARGFNGSKSYRLFSERWYDYSFGKLVLKINNFLSVKLPKLKNDLINSKQKYAYSITKDWLDSNGFVYDSINIVDSADQKVNFLKKVKCDLFIDDLSHSQNLSGSYVKLYDSVIDNLIKNNINFEIFNIEFNNWAHITEKYLNVR